MKLFLYIKPQWKQKSEQSLHYKGDQKIIKEEAVLYEKLFKNKTTRRLETYKQHKTLFEKIKKTSRNLYYQKKLQKCKNNIKTSWKTIRKKLGNLKSFMKIF